MQRALADQMRDIDKERELHKREEAMRHFTGLLADLVRSTELPWKEVKKIIKKDSRYDLCDALSKDEREKLYNEHIDELAKKKREKFREMLNELPNIKASTSWKEVKKLVREDPRYTKFSSSSEKCEKEFKDYLRDKVVLAKAAFRELLQETKLLTHKTFDTIRENPNHMKEIEEILKNDKRYLDLDDIAETRTEIIYSHLEDLEKRGPPPPPTATTAYYK